MNGNADVPMLFSEEDVVTWKREWQNMPEYSVEDLAPQFQVIVNFSCAEDVEAFGKLVGQTVKATVGRQLKSIWFPEQEIGRMTNKRYVEVRK